MVLPNHEVQGLVEVAEDTPRQLLSGDLREPGQARLCTVGLYTDGQAGALVELELDEAVVDLY